MNAIEYSDLDLPDFINTHKAIEITGYKRKAGKIEKETIALPLSDVIKIVALIGGSLLNVGDTRCGKSLAMMDIHRHYFGGDADCGGRSNLNVARNNFTSAGYFMTIDKSELNKDSGLVIDARVPVKKRVNALCNIIDELNLAIPEVQVEFFGIAEGRHEGMPLGKDGYNLFMASCNINRVNGDFVGISQINRALLNRIGVTIDFDYFRQTDEDADQLASKASSGRLKLAPIRDISDKILAAHSEIMAAASRRDPWLDAYLRLFNSGLDYCHKDGDKRKKRAWPTKCGNCNFTGKRLCSSVKQSNTGTNELMKLFAVGINYLLNLKHPGFESFDPFDLALEAFKFTTYHGNLNGIETSSTYSGEDQEHMAKVVETLRGSLEGNTKKYIDFMVAEAVKGSDEPRLIQVGDSIYPYDDGTKSKLSDAEVSHEVVDTSATFRKFGEKTGLRLDWLPGYIKTLASEAGAKG